MVEQLVRYESSNIRTFSKLDQNFLKDFFAYCLNACVISRRKIIKVQLQGAKQSKIF